MLFDTPMRKHALAMEQQLNRSKTESLHLGENSSRRMIN
jgi:hypothetical protein